MTFRPTRRQLLASSTLAAVGTLPFTRNLIIPTAQAQTGPKYLFVVYHPFGCQSSEWYPDEVGRDFKLKSCSAPLEDIRNDIIMFKNIDNAMGEKNECFNGMDQHSAGVCSIFSGATMTIDQQSGGPTIDTQIAKHLHPNLHHDDVVANLGVRSDEHKTAKSILKKSDGTVIVSDDDPSIAFSKIFGKGGQKAAAAAAAPAADPAKPFTALKDALRADLGLFESGLAQPERERFQEYMNSFAKFEESLDIAPVQLNDCAVPDVGTLTKPITKGFSQADFRPIAKVQTDLGVLALGCGARRVVTLHLTGGFTGFFVPPGVTDDTGNVHGHKLSHSSNKKLLRNLSWNQAKMFTDVVKGLKQAVSPMTGGSLFDDSVVLWGSCLSGNGGGGHSKLKVPMTVAAGKNTGYNTGRAVDANYGTASMLLRTIATSFGMPDQPFGDEEFSGQPLGGVFEDTGVAGQYDRNVLDYYGIGKYPRCKNHVK